MIPVGFGILAEREIDAGLVWLENNRENLALFGKRPQVKENERALERETGRRKIQVSRGKEKK